jgi:hypothetical protein
VKASPPPDPAPSEAPAPPEAVAPATEPPAPEPTPKEPPRPATWPEWFGAVDFALVVMAVVVGFLAASFPARNSDLWLQLASGRNLVEGNYTPGADPFTFSGADRAWADTSWLHDLAQYALYSADPTGAALVAVKAVAFAAAFGLLFLLRRTGQALWPWAVLVALGVLSSAPSAEAQSIVWSVLFLAATLVILYRCPWRPGTWREPLTLAGLFAVWANLDAWFLLGPLTIALVLAGEKLHPLLTREKGPQADDPFPPAPPTGLLGRTLLLGVVACLLNPMVLAALVKDPGTALAQLIPIEFGVPSGAATDAELAVLSQKPFFSDGYFVFGAGTPDEQVKLPSLAFALFSLISLGALVAGLARLRATHILLWVAFAALALAHVRLIPFFVVVAAPLAAAHLNGLSGRIRLGSWSDTQTRLTLTGSALGRVLTVVAVLLLLGASYPGWLHNPVADPADANRLEWIVSPDAGMVRAAKLAPRLRAGLPETARGLNVSVEFGNYCAWHAPGERVFVNGRFAFHRPELADLLTVRQALIGRRPTDDPAEIDEVVRVCDARAAGFLSYASRSRLDHLAVGALLEDEDRWVLWHLDGRFAVFGRLAGVGRDVETRLKYDPVRLAFGPEQEPLPDVKTLQPLRVAVDPWEAFLNEYLARPGPVPPEVDDVEMLLGYNEYLRVLAARRWHAILGATHGGTASLLLPPPASDGQLAMPLILTRLAWRAVAANPDRPGVYRAVSLAYGQPYTPTTSQPLAVVQMHEKDLQILTALARYLARVPPPAQCSPEMKREAFRAAMRLNGLYRQTGQLDLAREVFGRMIQLAETMTPGDFPDFIPPGPKMGESFNEFLKQMKAEEDRLARLAQHMSDQVNRQPSPERRFQMAAQGGQQGRLPGKAIEIYQTASAAGEAWTNNDDLKVALIVMELRAGRLEDAAAHLGGLDEDIKRLVETRPNDDMTVTLRALQGVQARLEGNFAAAAAALPGSPARIDPKFADVILGLPVEYARLGNPQAATLVGALVGSPAGLHTGSLLVRQVLMDESTYQYERAMLALSDANTPEAKRRLEQAAKPQGLDLARVGDVNRLAQIKRYLELIRRADGPAGP